MKKDKKKPVIEQETKVETNVSEVESTENVEEINPLEQKLAQSEEMLKRVAAEYDNFKKRSQREKDSLYSDVRAETVAQFLPVLDNLERAVSVPAESDEAKSIVAGVDKILVGFLDILSTMGVKKIPIDSGFDPNVHNAVMHIDDDNYEANQVVEEFMKGYMYKEKVIRHSMVKVAN